MNSWKNYSATIGADGQTIEIHGMVSGLIVTLPQAVQILETLGVAVRELKSKE